MESQAAPERQRQVDLHEFEASLVYGVSSRLARAIRAIFFFFFFNLKQGWRHGFAIEGGMVCICLDQGVALLGCVALLE